MARNTGDLLTLFDDCPELLLNVNLNILRQDLKRTNKVISWLPLLTEELEKYEDITGLNLYEKITLFVEIKKYLPKIHKLQDDLLKSTTSTDDLSLKPYVNHPAPTTIENTIRKENKIPIDVIQKQYYPPWIVDFVRTIDKCHVSTVRIRPDNDIECLLCHSKTFFANVTNIKGHLRSRKHLSKVSEDYHNLVKFHWFWERQTPETWMNHMQFRCAADCLICVVCHRNVKYEDVADHSVTCSWAVALQHSILGKPKRHKTYTNTNTSTDSLTARRPIDYTKPIEPEETANEQNKTSIDEIQEEYYPSSIVNFVRFLDKCEVCTVRLRPDGDVECLLCHDKTLYTNMVNIKQHLRSKRHLNNVAEDRKSLAKFHKFWRRQTPETWKSHMHFNYAYECLRCVVCRKRVEYTDVADHLVVCSDAGVPQTSISEKTYKRKTSPQQTVFKDVPSIKIDDNTYPTFQRLPDDEGFICLVCNEHVDGILARDRHTTSIRHVRRLGDEAVQESLVRYHETWKLLPDEMQSTQTHFQRGPDMMICKFCGDKFVDYDAERVRRHLTVVDHSGRPKTRDEMRRASRVKRRARSTSTETDRKRTYSARRVVYRDVPTTKIGDATYPTFQRLPADKFGRGFLCLVCNEHVDGLHSRDRHATSIRHVRRQGEKTVRESLIRYHCTWNALPDVMQLRQTHFERGSDKMKCKICPDKYVEYDAECLRKHLQRVEHPSRSEIRNMPKGVSLDKFLDRVADCPPSRIKKRRRSRKYNFFRTSSSDTESETANKDSANLLPRLDNNRAEPLHRGSAKILPLLDNSRAGCSPDRLKRKRPPAKYNFYLESSSDTEREMLHQTPAKILRRSVKKRSDLKVGEDRRLRKTAGTEGETAEGNSDDDATSPDYNYINYHDVLPDFIPLTRNSTEQLILNPLMVTTDPSSVDIENNNKPINTAQSVVYRDVPTLKIGDDTYPTFQHLPAGQYEKGFLCLVCNEHVDGLDARDHHVASNKHVRRQAEKTVQESLIRYHRTWKGLPDDMQLRQTQFERGPDKMKCKICPDTYVEYDAECLREHLTSVAHWTRSEIRKVLCEPWWDNVLTLAEGGSIGKKKRKMHSQPSQDSLESSSVTALATLHQEPTNPLPISDNNKPDLNAGEDKPPRKMTKTVEETVELTVDGDKEKMPPGYVYFDYIEPDFIPLTRNYPKVTSELVLNPMMVKTDQRCSNNNNNDTNNLEG